MNLQNGSYTMFLRRLVRWVLRFRKRCGYGIHSPFAFQFVTGVVYEKGEYYAYRQLCKDCHSSRLLRIKDYKLLFRIANFQQASTFTVFPDKEADTFAFEALMLGKRMRYATYTGTGKVELIYAAENWESQFDKLISQLTEGGMLIVRNLRGRTSRKAWKGFLMHQEAVVTFDLGDFGIVMNRSNLQHENYVINYF